MMICGGAEGLRRKIWCAETKKACITDNIVV